MPLGRQFQHAYSSVCSAISFGGYQAYANLSYPNPDTEKSLNELSSLAIANCLS